jgi:hypothetical protein
MCFRNAAVLIDDVRNAPRVFVLVARRRAVCESDLVIDVGQQRERKIEFLGEAGVVRDAVEADAEDGGVLRLVRIGEVPEPGTLNRSAGCVGLRIEPEHDAPSAQSGQANGVAVMIEHFEIGSGIAHLQHRSTSGHGAHRVTNHSAQ